MSFSVRSIIFKNAICLAAASAAAMAIGVAPAMAGTASSDMTVDATVTNNCIVDSASALHFGSLDSIAGTSTSPTGNSQNGSGDVNYSCTNGSNPTVYLSAATSSLAGAVNTGDHITATYYESDYTTAFPITSGTADALTGDGATHVVTVYGTVATTTATKADTYTGAVTVNVAY
jgi:spore coat protein U-like protein